MFYPLYHLESINIIRAFCFHIPQVEGPRTPEEMITILQRVVEECATQLVAARIEAEERLNNHLILGSIRLLGICMCERNLWQG
jgi:hypothetical protein